MTTEVLGSLSFLETPTVAGVPVLLNAGATPSVQAGTLAARPAPGVTGRLYVDTTNDLLYRDTGTAWVTISAENVLLQVATGNIGATSTTATIPINTSPPTSTAGAQIWTTSFTPQRSTSTICAFYAIGVVTSANNINVVTSVFSDTTNRGTAVTRVAVGTGTAGVNYTLVNQCAWTAGSTATITVQARFGPATAATAYCNSHATPFFGGALVSQYLIMELA